MSGMSCLLYRLFLHPLYSIDAQRRPLLQDFFRYIDILVYVEGTIYHIDEANERLSKRGISLEHAHAEGLQRAC